jgi:hypothetical protein
MGEPPNTGRLIQSTLTSGKAGPLQALVKERRGVAQYYYLDPTADVWNRDSMVSMHGDLSGCLIQSKYGATVSNFEAVVCEGRNLVHYSRNFAPGSPWRQIAVISTQCLGPASLIQARFIGSPINNPGNLEVAVLEAKPEGGSQLVLYTRDNTKTNPKWTPKGTIISTLATGPGALIQNSFIRAPEATGNYEVVVLEGNNLVHYSREATGTSWVKDQNVISSQATANGPGSIIQSTLTIPPPSNGNLEVVVLEGQNLVLYWSETPAARAPREWKKSRTVITNKAMGPGSIIQRAAVANGNFELIVIEDSLPSPVLAHYSRDNSVAARPWIRRNNVSNAATP